MGLDRRQIGSIVLSIGVHALLFATCRANRDPVEVEEAPELIVIDLVPEPLPPLPDSEPEPKPAPLEAAPAAESESNPKPKPNPKPEPKPNPTPESAPDLPVAEDPQPAARGSGLALQGLRRGSAAPAPRLKFRPGSNPAKAEGPNRGAWGLVSPSNSDGQPRSLAESGFKRKRDGTWLFKHPKIPFKARVLADGRMEFQDLPGRIEACALGYCTDGEKRERKPGAPIPPPIGLAIPHWTPYDAIRKASGQTLAYKQKKAVLEQTRELRRNLAIAWAKEQLEKRLRALDADLRRIWRNEERSASMRRRALFEVWDDCEDAPAIPVARDLGELTEVDAARGDAAARARKTVLEFIRRRLPQGSSDAYTPAELEQLNARRHSRARFAPYPAATARPRTVPPPILRRAP